MSTRDEIRDAIERYAYARCSEEDMWPCPTIRALDATPASPYRAATTREKENTDDHQPR